MDYLIGAVSWDVIQVALTQFVTVCLNQLPVVEDGEQRHQQTPVFVVSHPPTVVTFT